MSHPTTTIGAIRDQQVATIHGLTPRVFQTDIRFKRDEGSFRDFRELARKAGSGAFRRFTINLPRGARGVAMVGEASNKDVEVMEARGELLVAYPNLWAGYGDDGRLEQSDVIERDFDQIRRAIGINGGANYVGFPSSGQIACWVEECDVEDSDPVTFLTVPLRVRWFQSNS